MAKCYRCGREQVLPQWATYAEDRTGLGRLIIFYRIACQGCGCWLEDRLHPDFVPKPIVSKAA